MTTTPQAPPTVNPLESAYMDAYLAAETALAAFHAAESAIIREKSYRPYLDTMRASGAALATLQTATDKADKSFKGAIKGLGVSESTANRHKALSRTWEVAAAKAKELGKDLYTMSADAITKMGSGIPTKAPETLAEKKARIERQLAEVNKALGQPVKPGPVPVPASIILEDDTAIKMKLKGGQYLFHRVPAGGSATIPVSIKPGTILCIEVVKGGA